MRSHLSWRSPFQVHTVPAADIEPRGKINRAAHDQMFKIAVWSIFNLADDPQFITNFVHRANGKTVLFSIHAGKEEKRLWFLVSPTTYSLRGSTLRINCFLLSMPSVFSSARNAVRANNIRTKAAAIKNFTLAFIRELSAIHNLY